MTITSFDNGMPNHFYKEKSMQGRLMIFLVYVAQRVLKRDLIRKEKDQISIIVLDKEHVEMLYEGKQLGVIKLITMTKDFIFKQ